MEIGQVLAARYRVIADGNERDIGTAYKAYDMQQDRLVVVLLLAPRFGSGAGLFERLTQAQQAVADLAQPTLVPFRHVARLDRQLYLVRDQIEGHTLADFLAKRGRLGVEAAVEIATGLGQALAPAHRAGWVHGGLSPECVYVQPDGQVVVAEAGLLPALQPVPAPPDQPWGRPPYLSPEQAAGAEAHAASDVYVMGLLLYRMLAGRPPFDAVDESSLAAQHLRHDPPPLQTHAPSVPEPLAQIVHKALAKEPAARYRNAGQLASILRSQVGGEPRTAAAPPLLPPEERLLVPAPIAEDVYRPAPDTGDWVEEPAGVDWLMIALILAALIAVLGLIPLWRTLYLRYAAPAPIPGSSFQPQLGGDAECGPVWPEATLCQAKERVRLADSRLVWYNLALHNALPQSAIVRPGTSAGPSQSGTKCLVWESSLRAQPLKYTKL